MIYSCKDCQQRYPGCHGKCETYKKEKAAHEEQRAAQKREREIRLPSQGQPSAGNGMNRNHMNRKDNE